MRVGRRGEIYTTKGVRERVGIVEGGYVIAFIVGDKLVMKPIVKIEDKIRRYLIELDPNTVEELSEEVQKEEGIYG